VLVALLWPVQSADWRRQAPTITVGSDEIEVRFDGGWGAGSLGVRLDPFLLVESPRAGVFASKA
jgi:hypothetical protein